MKTRWKLTKDEIQELTYLYIFKGWNDYHLSQKFHISQQASFYRTKGLTRQVPALKKLPEELNITRVYVNEFGEIIRNKSYQEYLRDKQRKDLPNFMKQIDS